MFASMLGRVVSHRPIRMNHCNQLRTVTGLSFSAVSFLAIASPILEDASFPIKTIQEGSQ